MRIAVVGAGGVGGYFGARLAAHGLEVWFVARGAHLEAIADAGLHVLSPLGDLRIHPAHVVRAPAAIGPVDVVLFTTKLFDLESAARASLPLVGPDTVAIPFQNGIEATATVARSLPGGQVAAGVTYIGAVIERPGVVRHTGSTQRILFGEAGGGPSPRLERFRAVAAAAGIDAVLVEDIQTEIWRKFTLLAPMAGATSLRREPIGAVLADPDGRALFEALLHETAAVGRAAGVPLPDDLEAKALAVAEGLPKEMRSSMLNDLAAGRRLELEWLTGAVVRLGREHGVPTPRNGAVYAALAPFKEGGS